MSTERRILEWLIPSLLAMLLGILSWMALSIERISESLAVTTTKLEDHEQRLHLLEEWIRHIHQRQRQP